MDIIIDGNKEYIGNSRCKQYHILASMAYSHHNEFVEGFDTYEEAHQKLTEYTVNGDPYEVLTIRDNWEYEKERGITIKPVDTPTESDKVQTYTILKEKGMNTNQLIKEILSHPELHDLITHLGDFKVAVRYYTERLDKDIYVSEEEEEYESTMGYWNRQNKVLDKLLDITKCC